MSASVLYDAPGPRARRRSRILSVVSILVLAGLAVAAVLQLRRQGQLDPELWAPLLWPGDENFAQVWSRFLLGIGNTILAAFLAITFSLVVGTAVTSSRLMLGRTARLPLVVLVEILRGSPVIVLIFFAGKMLPALGVDLPLLWYLVIGLTLYNSVVIAEILRAGVAALPRGQAEAGLAIGMTRRQTLLAIQLPQAFRLMLPALISQLVVIVKDTSLARFVLTGPDELLRVGNQVFRFFDNPLQTYTVIALVYIVLNVLLSRLAVFVERRLSAARGQSSATRGDQDQAALQAQTTGSRTIGTSRGGPVDGGGPQ